MLGMAKLNVKSLLCYSSPWAWVGQFICEELNFVVQVALALVLATVTINIGSRLVRCTEQD